MFSSNMNFRTLTIVTDVLRTLNFTDVARSHGITQPAVSLQVNKFEDIVGIDLIKRVGNRMVLTEAGKQALQMGEAILKMLEEMGRIRLTPAAPKEAIGLAPDIALMFQHGSGTSALLEERYTVIDSSDNLKQRFEAREIPTVARFLFDFEENTANAVSVPFVWATYGGDGSAARAEDPLLVDLPCPSTPLGEAALHVLSASKLRHKVVREWSEGLYPGPDAGTGEPLTHVVVPAFRLAELGLIKTAHPALQADIVMHAGFFTSLPNDDRALATALLPPDTSASL